MLRSFRVFLPVGALTLFGSELLLITSCFIVAAFLVLDVDLTVFLLHDGGLARIAVVVASILLGLYFNDLYASIRVKSRILLAQQLCLVMGIAFVAQAFISYMILDWRVSLRVMLLGSALTMVTIFWWRVLYGAYVLRVVGGQRCLFVGGGPLMQELATYIAEHPDRGLRVAGYVGEGGPPGVGKLLGPLASLREIATAVKPDRIVVGLSERRDRMPVADLLELRFAGYAIEEAATTYETIYARVCARELHPAHFILSSGLRGRPKRVLFSWFGYLVALAGAVVTAPLLCVCAVAVKLSSHGPILEREERVGLEGVLFTLYKFRTTRADGEAFPAAEPFPRNEPRITRAGRILRKLGWDGLPQLFNVLLGEMALVGPRPERPEVVKALSEQIPYYPQRHRVKPGITGWAQINGPFGETFEDRVRALEYDLYYIKYWLQGLDAYIIFHELKTMLGPRHGR